MLVGDTSLPFPLDRRFLFHVALARRSSVNEVVEEPLHHDEDTLDVAEVHP